MLDIQNLSRDLSHAILDNLDLECANLTRARIMQASLKKTNLINANLKYVNLEESDLSGANLHGANLSNSNLSKTRLCYANMRYSILIETNLKSSDLSNCDLSFAFLQNTNLDCANIDGAFFNETASIEKYSVGFLKNCAVLGIPSATGPRVVCGKLNLSRDDAFSYIEKRHPNAKRESLFMQAIEKAEALAVHL